MISASTWPQWAAAFGVAIEFFGFLILGLELMQTNRKALDDAKLLASETKLFTSLSIDAGNFSDPNSGGASVEGGVLGRLVESIPRREKEVERSRKMILIGVAVSGVGVVVQIAGAFGQAWTAN